MSVTNCVSKITYSTFSGLVFVLMLLCIKRQKAIRDPLKVSPNSSYVRMVGWEFLQNQFDPLEKDAFGWPNVEFFRFPFNQEPIQKSKITRCHFKTLLTPFDRTCAIHIFGIQALA